MTPDEAAQLLEKFRAGKISQAKVLAALGKEPVKDLGFAQVDQHRALRQGFPEVIFGAGKTPVQVVKIAGEILKQSDLMFARPDSHFSSLEINKILGKKIRFSLKKDEILKRNNFKK